MVAALERIATSAVIAEHAVMHGNETGPILVVRYRLPRVPGELAKALNTLTGWGRRDRAAGARSATAPQDDWGGSRPCRCGPIVGTGSLPHRGVVAVDVVGILGAMVTVWFEELGRMLAAGNVLGVLI